jgi:putative flippase GtrA
MDKIKKLIQDRERFGEILRYLLFGVLTTLVSWAVYFLLTSWLKPDQYADTSGQRALILNGAQIASWVLSVLFAFVTNKRYVFQSQQKRRGAAREFLLFVSARALSYLLFDLLLYNLFVFALDVNHGLTKILMNVLVVLFNYFASRYVIFAKKNRPPM